MKVGHKGMHFGITRSLTGLTDILIWRPRSPTVTVLRADGLLAELIIYPGMGAIHESREAQELADQCQKLMQEHGFLSIPFDGNRLYIMPDETSQPDVFEQFKEYMRWRWICGLIQGDFDALNSELYNYFGTKPERLERLHWREFEKLVAELLESQGFVVELGPGSADGGVDLRFLQRDPIGDVLTLVQVKKYRKDRKIRLDAVQALHGARMAERADGSMFITTSSYLPSAKKFAGRENVLMNLHISDDVRNWCVDATAGIVKDGRRLTTEREVIGALEDARANRSRIIHAICGHGMRYNRFSLVLKESASSALVVDLPRRIVVDEGYQQAGTEVPDLKYDRIMLNRENSVRRLKKSSGDTHFRYSDINEELEFYEIWDQKPARFFSD